MSFNRKYFLLLLLLIFSRLMVLIMFSFRFADHDQVTLWLGAIEMAQGNFYEPCFWGQSYSPMAESLLAVPFILMHIPCNIALPLVTAGISLFPFVWISLWYKRQKNHFNALLFLLIPLLYSVQYDIISSMPRGWVTGIFVSSISCFALFRKGDALSWFFYGFCMLLGLWLNPNSVYLSAFTGLMLLIENRTKPIFYVMIALGMLLPAMLWLYSAIFYYRHPFYNFHYSPDLSFTLRQIALSFSELQIYFRQLGFFHGSLGTISFFSGILLIIILYIQRKLKAAFIFTFLYICAIASLGISKTGDSHDNLFFSGARFFLAFPVLMAFMAASLNISSGFKKRVQRWVLIIALAGIAIKVADLYMNFFTIEKVGKNNWVTVDEVSFIKKECKELNALSKKYDVSLIVFESYPDQLMNYGCPCFEKSFPSSLFPWYERRSWRLLEEKDKVHQNILFVRPETEKPLLKDQVSPDIYLRRDNTVSTYNLLYVAGYEIRD